MTRAFDPVAFLERAVDVASHESVEEMRALLVDELESRGADPRVDAAGTVRAAKGAGDPHLVLNTHLDTVPPHVPPRRDGDAIHGRGACDAKGPLAALLSAFLAAEPSAGRLTLAVTPDEETHSAGADALVRGPDALDGDLFVVGEPTDCDVCIAARGRFEATLELSGSAAHAAEPGSGVNAVAALEDALAAVRSFDDGRDPHSQLGPPTLVPTGVEGGEATNQVPASCRVTLDRRSVPPETAAGFRSSLEAAVGDAVPAQVDVTVTLADRDTPFLEAFDTDPEDELVRTLSVAAERAGRRHDRPTGDGDDSPGADGAVRPFGAATEASYFAPAPTVVFGPGRLADEEGAVAHAEREYVRVERVRVAAAALSDAVESLLA